MGELRASIRGATDDVPGDRAFSFCAPFSHRAEGCFLPCALAFVLIADTE